ncbi:AAHS family benzoate transporter-like MFS transporter [Kibdelosporangium banguiense]|uniref:AAHS family benzoate transporter-like MFS transporter n=1 Tax=Kibdelosporangium banguiense TaxID=1365924 RepID=A0ABS4T7I6_9PSEU|nr:aromatic acid/H+ symport family MFS transporter [Kibdelosporangium banguiense]MBP2320373.1 AAHS family benzoate transporter-like MFS transporter [Kibdelosporangium banguiense]
MTSPARTSRRSGLTVVALCFLTIVFDGYDLIVYGSAVPSLLAEPGWNIGTEQAGAIGSYALAGMLVGALGAGAITDVLGRRRIMLIGITWFSVMMVLCALAPNPTMLGILRFVAGLGLGGVIPSAISLTVEYAPRRRRQLYNAAMFVGYSVGGVLAAVMALILAADHGWRPLFAIGAAPLLIVLPLAIWLLPESAAYLRTRGRHEEAEALTLRYGLEPQSEASAERLGPSTLFRRDTWRATILFGLASFCGLLLVYGLNTWLPQIMRKAGYPLGSALTFLLILNVGAIVGGVLAAVLADRVGSKPVTAAAFLVATACLIVLSLRADGAVLYIAVAAAGLGSVGTQILVNGYVAVHYPAAVRATALGWALGVGRAGAIVGPLFGGWVLASGAGFEWNFYGFAVPALLGAVLIVMIPRRRAAASPQPAGDDSRPAAQPVG